MAAVQLLVAAPRWERTGAGEGRLGPQPGDTGPGEVRTDGRLAGVVVAEPTPAAHDLHPVAAERLLVTRPHEHRRVVLPAVPGDRQRAHDLEHLDPLLAEASGVEHRSAAREVRVGQEGLHARGFPRPPAATPRTG